METQKQPKKLYWSFASELVSPERRSVGIKDVVGILNIVNLGTFPVETAEEEIQRFLDAYTIEYTPIATDENGQKELEARIVDSYDNKMNIYIAPKGKGKILAITANKDSERLDSYQFSEISDRKMEFTGRNANYRITLENKLEDFER